MCLICVLICSVIPAKNRPFGCKFAPRLWWAGLYEEYLSNTVFPFFAPGLFVQWKFQYRTMHIRNQQFSLYRRF